MQNHFPLTLDSQPIDLESMSIHTEESQEKKRKFKEEIKIEEDSNIPKKIKTEEKKTILMFEFFFGINRPKNLSESKKICNDENRKGNLISQGFSLFLSWNEKKEQERSKEYFRKSLESNEYNELEKSYCHYFLGCLHFNSQALKYFEESSLMGNCQAFFELGKIYFNNKIKNVVKSIECFEKASQLGNSSATFRLSLIYLYGDQDVEKNIPKGLDLLQKAFEMENSDAINNLAFQYKNGSEFFEINTKKSIGLLEKSASLGNTTAIKRLFLLYKDGEGTVKKNHEKCALFLHQKYQIKNKEKTKEQLIDFLEEHKVNWKKEYHIFWKGAKQLDQQVFVLLLLSKHRKESNNFFASQALVKLITFSIIKFLCNFNQLDIEKSYRQEFEY